MTTQGDFTTSGMRNRVFLQRDCGDPLIYVGCVGVNGVQLDPVALAYARCVGSDGQVRVKSIPRYPDPVPFTVTVADNFGAWHSLFKRIRNGCPVNMFLASIDCEKPQQVTDPSYYKYGVWLTGLYPTQGYQVGNDTFVLDDPNNADAYREQVQMAFKRGFFVAPYRYISVNAAIAAPFTSLTVVDIGQCRDFVCVACTTPGCQVFYANTGTKFRLSLDGGATWADEGAAAAGIAQSINGVMFRIEQAKISTSIDYGSNWSVCVTDVAFPASPLSNIAVIDARTLVIGSKDGQTWRSINGGASWKEVRVPVPADGDLVNLVYDSLHRRIVGMSVQAAATDVVISEDMGESWTVIGTVATADPFAHSYYTGGNVYMVIDHNLYKIDCDAVVPITILGLPADGVTGVGGCDPDNCNEVFLTVVDANGDGQLWKSNDGLATAKPERLVFSLPNPSTDINPIACCMSEDGIRPVFNYGDTLFYGDNTESFFASYD